ncbi:MAG: arylsulfotransferase family protein [Candidatus Eisenbacteria bacterium]
MPKSASSSLAMMALVCVCALVLTACERDGQGSGDASGVTPGDEWARPGGRWHPTDQLGMTEEQRSEVERLRSIGYVAGSQAAPENTGITQHDPLRSFAGLNFYTSGHAAGAVLMDMDGNVLHEWSHSFIDAWKTGPREELPKSTKGAGFWRRAHLFENGDVLAIFDGMGLIKVDKNSELIWAYLEGVHHDLDVLPDGRIFVLIREAHMNPSVSAELPVLEDYIAVLDGDGNELRRVALLDAFRQPRFSHYLDSMKESGDIFHTNTIEVLGTGFQRKTAGFDRGNVLVCVREIDVVAVVDMMSEEVVWAARAPWSKPHQSTVLPNGNILIFDNRGYGGVSRVVEFDPATLAIVWDYHGEDPADFYSKECGSNQRLPNGNTLITLSDAGRAIEVTPARDIVWEFVNPTHAGADNEFIASVFDMVRLAPDFPLDWLEED